MRPGSRSLKRHVSCSDMDEGRTMVVRPVNEVELSTTRNGQARYLSVMPQIASARSAGRCSMPPRYVAWHDISRARLLRRCRPDRRSEMKKLHIPLNPHACAKGQVNYPYQAHSGRLAGPTRNRRARRACKVPGEGLMLTC